MTLNELIDCPYCCEPIRRQASRCKHCHADLSGPAANKQVFSTAGGAGSLNLGGHFGHIEGGIHFSTLGELDSVDETTKNILLKRYEQQVRDFPETAQYQFALGLSYLDQNLYDRAATHLERALGKTTKEANLLYYLSLARLGGRHPRALKSSCIQELERFLMAAIRLDDRAAHCRLLLAAIKFDYYALNGLRVPPPAVEDLLYEAARMEVDRREIRVMLRHVSLPNGRFLSVIKQFC
jgi:tetratricopeptide (TPR) repeat protein